MPCHCSSFAGPAVRTLELCPPRACPPRHVPPRRAALYLDALGAASFAVMAILAAGLKDELDWQWIAIARTGLAMIFAAALAMAAGKRAGLLSPGQALDAEHRRQHQPGLRLLCDDALSGVGSADADQHVPAVGGGAVAAAAGRMAAARRLAGGAASASSASCSFSSDARCQPGSRQPIAVAAAISARSPARSR